MSDEEAVIVKGGNKSEKILIFTVLIILLAIVLIFSLKNFVRQESPKTLDDLHILNLQGKLDPDQGYVYAGYSFVNLDDMWYTQIMSPKRSKMYDTAFRFDPKGVEDVLVEGRFDATLFDAAETYYVTFDPLGTQHQYVALAVGDFNNNMMKIFEKTPIAACDKNETDACKTRPIITCENSDEIIFYVKEANETKVVFDDNCIIVQGSEFDIIRATDRLLYVFYKIQ